MLTSKLAESLFVLNATLFEIYQNSDLQELVDKLLTSKLAESSTAKAGLEDMRLLLSYCKLYTCSEVSFTLRQACSSHCNLDL